MGSKHRRCGRLLAAVALGVAVIAASPQVQANDMDPVLARMWTVGSLGGAPAIVTRDDLFDGLALDLAQALAPNVLHPAETLGWSGFYIGLEANLTIIDAGAPHWRCGIENTGSGQYAGGNNVCDSWDVSDGALFVPAIHVRKGFPYSLEVGFQVQYVANSEMVAIGGEIRWAPFEGFREGWMGYLPDFSVSFAGNYLMGSNELVLGQLGANFMLSYPFTISGQATITPYFGYQFFIVGADQEQVHNSLYVEDPQEFRDFCSANGIDPGDYQRCNPFIEFHGGGSRNFGQNLDTLKYHRLYLGARILWENLAITPQFGLTMPWFTGEAEDTGTHFQVSLSVGSDF